MRLLRGYFAGFGTKLREFLLSNTPPYCSLWMLFAGIPHGSDGQKGQSSFHVVVRGLMQGHVRN
jgi:hypothetical protein